MDDKHNPTIVIPYPGAGNDPAEQDIFIYLRPESNGVLVESTLLRVVQNSGEYKKQIFLVYLANLPCEFVIRNRIMEGHYSLKMKFAARGHRLFTPYMKEVFSRKFGIDCERARVLGAFEALRVLNMNPEELFSVWVNERDIMIVNDQTIKKIGDAYVVNYDIPYLTNTYQSGANIAAMIFRTRMCYREFGEIVRMMEKALLDAGILLPDRPAARIFHYSRGPFEQVLDAFGHLYTGQAVPVPPEELPFPRFLASRGVPFPVVWGLMYHPIISYSSDGHICENSVFSYTRETSYEEAWEKIHNIKSQIIIPWEKEEIEDLDRTVQREFRGTVSL